MLTAPVEVVAPAVYTRPEYHATDGPLVAELCELVGYAPDPEQRMLLDDTFAVDARGRSTSFEVGVVACRQNLKTGFFKQAALGWLFVTEQRLTVWSAHLFGTTQEAFRDMDELCAAHPSVSRRVKKVYRGNGDEAIELVNGCRLIFKARSKGSGRGLSGDKVLLDEWLFGQAAHLGALMPTLSARPDPQVVYGLSAGLASSLPAHELRKRGKAGSPRLTYAEWGDQLPPSCTTEDCDHHFTRPGCCLDDEARWRAGNPALGRRISVEYIRAERQAMPPEEFARERLGWWDEPATDEVPIEREAWADLGDPDSEPGGELTVGVDVAPGHTASSIVVYGGGVLGMVVRKPGSSWLPDRLKNIQTKSPATRIMLDPAGPIGSLIPELDKAGVVWSPVEGKESVRACGAFIRAVTDKGFRHRGEAEFDAAVAGAKLRPVGEGHKWSRKDSTVDITPLVAATNALWGAGTIRDEAYDLEDSFG